jgi:NTP pyrophosphatase (non-canonical NTP hydrolase)
LTQARGGAATVPDSPPFGAVFSEEAQMQNHHLITAGDILTAACHGASKAAGWWTDKKGQDQTNTEIMREQNIVPVKLALIHSEVSEGLEGYRKSQMDDHLPHREMLEVELADAVIRIFDLAGALNYNLGAAISEKMTYNAQRADHKPENRKKAGGKSI